MADKEEEKAPDLSENEAPLEPEAVAPVDEKKQKIKKILMIAVPLIAIIIAGILFYVLVLSAQKKGVDVQDPADSKASSDKAEGHETNSYVDIEPITIPLLSSGGKREFLKIDLILRVGSDLESTAIVAKMPIIKDSLIGFLRSLRSADFNSSSNAIYLKEEVSKRINKIVAPIVIKEVLFQEIVIN